MLVNKLLISIIRLSHNKKLFSTRSFEVFEIYIRWGNKNVAKHLSYVGGRPLTVPSEIKEESWRVFFVFIFCIHPLSK